MPIIAVLGDQATGTAHGTITAASGPSTVLGVPIAVVGDKVTVTGPDPKTGSPITEQGEIISSPSVNSMNKLQIVVDGAQWQSPSFTGTIVAGLAAPNQSL